MESVQNTVRSESIGVTYTLIPERWTFSLNYTYDVLFSAGVTSGLLSEPHFPHGQLYAF